MQKMKITELQDLLKMFSTHRICDIFKRNFETNWRLKLAGKSIILLIILPYLLKTFFHGAFSKYMYANIQS